MPANIESLEEQKTRIEQQIRELKKPESFKTLVNAVKGGDNAQLVQACYEYLAQRRTRRGKKNKTETPVPSE